MSYIIGLTGGIGCGKSLVSQYLRERGLCVIDADRIAREIMAPQSVGLERAVQCFGGGILREDGDLDRARLAEIVFNDPVQLQRLNDITHPLIKQTMRQRIAEQAQEPVVILDVPLLFESGDYTELADEIWVVAATRAQQLARIMARDGMTRQQALSRMDKQWPTSAKAAKADAIIDNSGSMAATYGQVDALLARVGQMLGK